MNAAARPISKALQSSSGRIYAMVLGRVVAQVRRRRGIEQRNFAVALGVSTSAISRLESGVHTPDAFRIQRLEHELRLPSDQISTRVRAALEETERLAQAAAPGRGELPWWEFVEKTLGPDALVSAVDLGVAVALRSLPPA